MFLKFNYILNFFQIHTYFSLTSIPLSAKVLPRKKASFIRKDNKMQEFEKLLARYGEIWVQEIIEKLERYEGLNIRTGVPLEDRWMDITQGGEGPVGSVSINIREANRG